MPCRTLLTLAVAFGVGLSVPAPASADESAGSSQEPENGLSGLSLEDLMEIPVAVALPSRPRCLPQAPGIVTVVTRDEILQSGARDLIDVLSFVPGFHPALDVEGTIGFGVRGNWGHEGKVLFLLDGLELNELDYSTAVVDNRYPLDQIERIEIIRGPGSVVYGGFAELAVVNLVTRSADTVNGATLSTTLGVTKGALSRRTASVFAAAPVKDLDGLDVSVGAFLGEGQLSDRVYVDHAGRTLDLAGNSAKDLGYLNLAVRFRDTLVRFVVDQYRTTTGDGFGDALAAPVTMDFPSYLAEARTRLDLGSNVALHPRFTFKRQLPWRVLDPASPLFANRYVERYAGSLHGTWDPLPSLHVLIGSDATFDRAGLLDRRVIGLLRPYSNGKAAVAYQDVATLGQVAWQTDYVNLTAGVRHEFHTATGHSWVPRIDLTHSFDWLHLKLLYAHAFRAPGVQNLAINPDLSPERTIVAQAEVAATLGRYFLLSTSGFFTSIRQAIVFTSVEQGGAAIEWYENGNRTGTWGGDVTLQARHPRVWANLAWSFYSARGVNEVVAYRVPGHADPMLAFPSHKVTLNGALNVTERFFVSPSVIVLGPRYGRGAPTPDGSTPARRFDATVLANVHLGLRNVLFPGLHVSAGVFNLFDVDAPYIQAYDGGHAPIPGASREFVARFEYATAF
jgi:outer membrane cobalamin receptor